MASPWAKWMPGNREDDPDENQGEYKPEKLKEDLETSFKARLEEFKEAQKAEMSPLLEMAATFKASRDEAARREQADRNKQRSEESEVDDDLFITNPREAFDRSTKSIREQTAALAALTMRKEVLEDKEYYYGDFKTQVDQLIDSQPLNNRSNTAVLENAYYTVLGRRVKDIEEGKLKRKTFGNGFNGNGTGAVSGESKESERPLDEDAKRVMAIFGMSEKEMREGMREINYV